MTLVNIDGYIKYVNDLRDTIDDELLILDGGNFFQGHPLGIIDRGRTMIDWMNIVGYDAIVPGANDFLFGIDNLIELSRQADFKFLACNLFYKDYNNLIVEIKSQNAPSIDFFESKVPFQRVRFSKYCEGFNKLFNRRISN